MKIEITDSLEQSIKRLIWHQHWIYKIYSFFRWDLWQFFKNIWRFRNELYNHQWWDYRFTLNMLERSLEIMEKGLGEKGIEVPESRDKKVKSIQRVLELLKNNREDNYIQRAEMELGNLIHIDWEFEDIEDRPGLSLSRLVDNYTEEEKAHNIKVYDRAREIEEAEWKELWEIIKGTKNSRNFGKKYDGSDMRSWWD